MSEKKKDINLKQETVDKSQFEFVQKDKKLYDKKFQTKPIGYFKDAMMRFARNKTNVVASSILAVLILLSIFVPIFSTKNAEVLESQIAQLPPRIPILENWGIADGTASYEEVPISYDNPYLDADDNPYLDGDGNILYMPEGEYSEFIEEGSLVNYWLPCTNKESTCEDGTVELQKQYVDKGVAVYATHPEDSVDQEGNDIIIYTISELESLFFPNEVLIELEIDMDSAFNANVLDGTASFEVYFQEVSSKDGDDALVKVLDTSDPTTYESFENGIYSVNVADHPGLIFGDLFDFSVMPETYRVILAYESDIKDSGVIQSFRVHVDPTRDSFIYGPEEDPEERDDFIYAEGFELSQYKLATSIFDENNEALYAGNILRIDGQRLNADYTVDAYSRAFGPVYRNGFRGSEFEELMESCTYADGTPYDNQNPVPGVMDDNCPILELIERNDEDAITVPGKGTFYTYDVYLNYRVYAGYDEMPYYLFGTSAAGYDMVKLIWIGLRTSLLIGLVVSFINIAIGVVYGAISGYYGGQVDIIMQRFAEIIGRIPWLVTLSIFMAYFEAGFTSLILILIVSGWIGVASITRTQFYRYKGREYVLASRTLGAKDGRLIFRHILPNGIGTIITSSILMIPTVIFSEATLSYLGFGIGHGQSFSLFGIDALTLDGVSIGVLLNDGRNKLQNYPHLTLFPAIIISILMITFNMFGNALRDAFNPALRGSE
jgi:ABC-type dipeptide/oligopeptide/nickel transport system permease subunit